MKRKAIFLDKDGTLIPDVPYNVDPARMRLSLGVGPVLQKLQNEGYLLIVISNQSGIAKGFFPESAIEPMFDHLKLLLRPFRVRLEALYYCPHLPEGRVKEYAIVCECRKPKPGLIERAIADFNIDPSSSWMVGDMLDDIEAGRRAGVQTILFDPQKRVAKEDGQYREPNFIVSNFEDMYKAIMENKTGAPAGAPLPTEYATATNSIAEPSLRMDKMLDAIDSFKNKRILLLGDAALDRYLVGKAVRLNREAPVPIVDIEHETAAPGCAANAAVNIAFLGAHVRFLSVIGNDEEGVELRTRLARSGVDTSTIVTDAARRTLCKQRILGDEHMYVRFDTGTTAPLMSAAEDLLMKHLEKLYGEVDGMLISDYGYGVLTPRLLDRISELRARSPKPLLVDSKFLDRYQKLSPTIVKPNYEEACLLAGITAAPEQHRREEIVHAQDRLFERTGAHVIAVTLDSEGALLLERGQAPYHVGTKARKNTRAIGAGDTYAAALLLATTAGLSLPEMGHIAGAAAHIVVGKDGTAACSNRELQFYFASRYKRVFDLRHLHLLREGYERPRKRVVFTNGCFDILHSGHIAYLSAAKKLGDILIVGVNTDEGVRRLKGETRPVNALSDRLRVLSGLSSVDHVIAFGEDTAEHLVELLRPDVYVKGSDYSRETLPEAKIVDSYGGRVELIPLIPGKSTSSIIQKIQMNHSLPSMSRTRSHYF